MYICTCAIKRIGNLTDATKRNEIKNVIRECEKQMIIVFSVAYRKYSPLTPTRPSRSESAAVSGNTKRMSPVKAMHQVSPPEGQPCRMSAQRSPNKSPSSQNPSPRDTKGAIRIRMANASSRAQVVQISAVSGADYSDQTGGIIPSPPVSARPKIPRPSSADRFRKMVIESRDGIWIEDLNVWIEDLDYSKLRLVKHLVEFFHSP